jgi:hypothetical protein
VPCHCFALDRIFETLLRMFPHRGETAAARAPPCFRAVVLNEVMWSWPCLTPGFGRTGGLIGKAVRGWWWWWRVVTCNTTALFVFK